MKFSMSDAFLDEAVDSITLYMVGKMKS